MVINTEVGSSNSANTFLPQAMPMALQANEWEEQVCKGGNNSFFLYSSATQLGLCNKRKINKRKVYKFIDSKFYVTEAFIRKGRIKAMVKPKCFYARFPEQWKVVERWDRTKVNSV